MKELGKTTLLERQVANIYNRKQERITNKVKKGVPLAKDLKENRPEIWLTSFGPQMFVKINGGIFTIPMAAYPKGDLKDASSGENFIKGRELEDNIFKIMEFNIHDASVTAGEHHCLYTSKFDASGAAAPDLIGLGTGTDPATSLSISSNSVDYLLCYWILPLDIEVISADFYGCCDASNSLAAHIMAYDMDDSNGSDGGDLSNGVLIASHAGTMSAVSDAIIKKSMDINTKFIEAGSDPKVVLATVEGNSTSDVTAKIIVRYKYRS